MELGKRLAAEFIGTAWLVLGGCGAAVLAAAFPALGIGFVGVALAFGLTVLTMAFAIGHVSGCHLNPAVSVGLVGGRAFSRRRSARLYRRPGAGGIAGAGILYLIASGHAGFDVMPVSPATAMAIIRRRLFACSPPGLRSGDDLRLPVRDPGFDPWRAPEGFAPIAIGLCLTLIHLISIPVTNTSVNPARRTGPGSVRGRLGARPALAVLGGAHRGRAAGRLCLSPDRRRHESRACSRGRGRVAPPTACRPARRGARGRGPRRLRRRWRAGPSPGE